MKRIGWALALWMLGSGCKDKPAVTLKEAPAPAAPDPEAWALTLPKLDGYVRYQRALLVQAGKVAAPAFDGGALKQFDPQTIEQRATADEHARAQAGLTEEDVVRIEEMVSAVAAKRLTARMLGFSDKLPPPELPPDATQEQQAAMLAQTNLRKSALNLPEERQRFGDANIDLLLKREDQLLGNWALMLEVPELAEKRK